MGPGKLSRLAVSGLDWTRRILEMAAGARGGIVSGQTPTWEPPLPNPHLGLRFAGDFTWPLVPGTPCGYRPAASGCTSTTAISKARPTVGATKESSGVLGRLRRFWFKTLPTVGILQV